MKRTLFAVLIGCFALFAATAPSNATIFKGDKSAAVADSTEKKPAEEKKGKKKAKKKEG